MYACHIPVRRTNSTSACEIYKIFPAVLRSYGYENSVVFCGTIFFSALMWRTESFLFVHEMLIRMTPLHLVLYPTLRAHLTCKAQLLHCYSSRVFSDLTLL
jgi:hypothetical protein